MAPDSSFAAFPLILMLFFMAFGFVVFIFWIWTLIDCLNNEPSKGNDKITWAIVIIALQWIGALVYYFVRRPERIRKFGR